MTKENGLPATCMQYRPVVLLKSTVLGHAQVNTDPPWPPSAFVGAAATGLMTRSRFTSATIPSVFITPWPLSKFISFVAKVYWFAIPGCFEKWHCYPICYVKVLFCLGLKKVTLCLLYEGTWSARQLGSNTPCPWLYRVSFSKEQKKLVYSLDRATADQQRPKSTSAENPVSRYFSFKFENCYVSYVKSKFQKNLNTSLRTLQTWLSALKIEHKI